MLVLKDANGKYVAIEELEIKKAIEDGTFYGMPMEAIFEFRHCYIEHGGSLPITSKSIRELFEKIR